MRKDITLPGGSKIVSIPSVTDERGTLAYATAYDTIPFAVERVFWIYDVPVHQKRGGHAHRECSEVVFAAKGGFCMVVDDGLTSREVRIDNPSEGILIPAGLWCELKDFDPDTILVVLASHPYDAKGYIHTYSDYLEERKR